MYLLKETPIFLEFLNKFLELAGYEFKNKKIEDRLFLHSKCNCGQDDCATVYLKSKKLFKKTDQDVQIFETNKGYFFVHILENGYFQFEALLYTAFPYKNEIDKFFLENRKINEKIPLEKKDFFELSKESKENLDKYFNNFEFKVPNIIDLGEIDFRNKNN